MSDEQLRIEAEADLRARIEEAINSCEIAEAIVEKLVDAAKWYAVALGTVDRAKMLGLEMKVRSYGRMLDKVQTP